MLRTLFQRIPTRQRMRPLYDFIVGRSRQPFWYREGGVPDTIDGRFDVLASVLAIVLLRLETEGPQTREAQTMLVETFVDDMDGTLRQEGIGDLLVGKHVGRMMGQLGGRLTAYRESLGDEAALAQAVRRNIFRMEDCEDAAVRLVADKLMQLHRSVLATDYARLIEGRLNG